MAKPKSLPYEAADEEVPYAAELHSTAGGSDKIYKLTLERLGDGWVVNYANGRRGSTLTPGTKTPKPVPFAEARKICNAKLYEQVGKGYLPIGGSRFGDDTQAEAIASLAKTASGHVPQLLAPTDADGLERLLKDDRYVAERKHDGERRLLVVEGGKAHGANRMGQTVSLPARLREAVADYPDLVLDGEQIGDAYHFWDLISYRGIDLRERPLTQRQAALRAGSFERPGIVFATETAIGEEAKRRLVDDVRTASGEGVVFKRRDAAYDPGKPGSAASWHKFKFWASLSAVVEGAKKGRSVNLYLLDDAGGKVQVGGVTVPANHELPEPGTVVEIRYLYAFPEGGLHQPVYLGPRSDIPVSDCLASQRSFKPTSIDAGVPEEEASAPAGP